MRTAFALLLVFSVGLAKADAPKRNILIFVADGLRYGSVNPIDAPTMYELRQRGVHFTNSHALFPTFTTPNAAAIATGHYLGDTGDFANWLYPGFPIFNTGNFKDRKKETVTPFIEDDPILGDIDEHFPGSNFLDEETLLETARQNGFATAAVGKLGPTAIQDVTQTNPKDGVVPVPQTVILDDSTGREGGIPLNPEIRSALERSGLPLVAPTRGNGGPMASPFDNGFHGDNIRPGTRAPNLVQQQFFVDATTKAILPTFRAAGKPFAIVYWSRDPDGTQHNQGDSPGSLVPGINGPTSRNSVLNTDANLKQLLAYIDADPALKSNTDVFITSDHGFSTITHRDLDAGGKQFTSSYAATCTYVRADGSLEINRGFQTGGFLGIDIAHFLNEPMFDPDQFADGGADTQHYRRLDPTVARPTPQVVQHPIEGDALIGGTGRVLDHTDAKVIVAGNGGSDLVYLPDNDPARLRKIVEFLCGQDYVSGIFVDDRFGPTPGALPLSAINLKGSTHLPLPSIVVNFRTFATDPAHALDTEVQFADTVLQQGQGMHGSFGRGDTFNNMIAIGPDFKTAYLDDAPVGNPDVTITLAHVLGLNLPATGKLTGRVLSEALVGGDEDLRWTEAMIASDPAANGVRTILNYQELGQTRYFDAAGFPGRTVGLDETATPTVHVSHRK